MTTTPSTPIKSWFSFSGFFSGIYNVTHGILSSFASTKKDYPDTHYGMLMRRATTPTSWFDSISAQWSGNSFWTKLSVFAGVTLLFGILGFFSGVATLFSASAFVFVLGIHSALVSHDTQRINHAELFTKKTLQAERDLKVARSQLDDTKNQVHDLFQGTIKRQDEVLQELSKEIKNEAELVTDAASEFKTAVQKFEEKQKSHEQTVQQFSDLVDNILSNADHQQTEVEEKLLHHQESIEELGKIAGRFSNDTMKWLQLDEQMQQCTHQLKTFHDELKEITSTEEIEKQWHEAPILSDNQPQKNPKHHQAADLRMVAYEQDKTTFEEALITIDEQLRKENEAFIIQTEQIHMYCEDRNALDATEYKPKASTLTYDAWITDIKQQMHAREQILQEDLNGSHQSQTRNSAKRMKRTHPERIIEQGPETTLILASASMKKAATVMDESSKKRQAIRDRLNAYRRAPDGLGFFNKGANQCFDESNKENINNVIPLQ